MTEIPMLMLFGFMAGLVHALDADHIVAVTGLTSRSHDGAPVSGVVKAPPVRTRLWTVALAWAFGHGFMLLAIAMLVLVAGIALPQQFAVYTEKLVGVLLVVIGCSLLLKLYRKKVLFTVHQHDGLEPHAHFHHREGHGQEHAGDPDRTGDWKAHHQSVFVGFVHGAAGSAPLLGMLPALTSGYLSLAVAYIAVFSVAVAISMSVFGGLLAAGLTRLRTLGERWLYALHIALGAGTIGLGIAWM
jgi:cytochrome c biogenesis protein CcdA